MNMVLRFKFHVVNLEYYLIPTCEINELRFTRYVAVASIGSLGPEIDPGPFIGEPR